MAFDFLACAENDGIVFSYNNCENAVYVYRENGEIKEREVNKEEVKEETKLERYIKGIILFFIRGGLLILIEALVVVNLKIKMSYIWILYIISISIYIFCVVAYNIKDSKETSIVLKRYHSAEHMIYNADSIAISVEDLRKFSKYANRCGRNDDAIKIFDISLIGAITNVFCSIMLLKFDIYYYIAIYIFYIIILNFIYYIVFLAKEEGLFNHIFQPLFLEEPTDEELELAIYGIKRARELEQQNSN